MKGALAGAWLAATGLVIWRQLHGNPHVPVPGTLLAVTGLYAALGITADMVPQARTFIVLTAWGINVAGLANLWPAGLGGEVQQAAKTGTTTPKTGQPAQQPGTTLA